jgi:hypothetical protein
MITIPSLSDVTDIQDTDQVMVTNAQGQSYKIAGSELNKRHKVIMADSTTVTGAPLKTGNCVRIYFTADITAANATTTMQINYNNVNYYVKVPKNGALANYVAFNLGGSPAVFKYVQAYTTLELLFDGTQFIIMCNPVVISGTNFSIYADGLKRVDEVTENGTDLVTSHAVAAAIDKVKDIMGALPTDAVLHYSFDEVPDYPDGTRFFYANKDFVASEFIYLRCTASDTDGKLKVQNTSGDTSYIRQSNWTSSNLTSKIIKARIFIHSTGAGVCYFQCVGNDLLGRVGVTSGNKDKWIDLIFTTNTTADTSQKYLGVLFDSTSSENYFILESLYIGDGSYSTPIIDNANGQFNATNNGGIATKGVSGKGVYCNKKNITISNQNLTNNFTLSLWIMPENDTTNLQGINVTKQNTFFIRNGINGNNNLFLAYYQNETRFDKNIGTLLQANIWTHLVLSKNESVLKIYKNGINTNTFTVENIPFDQNDNNFNIDSSSNSRPQSYDDLLIFDRALTENEVMALYLNKANTPKYYPPAQLPS